MHVPTQKLVELGLFFLLKCSMLGHVAFLFVSLRIAGQSTKCRLFRLNPNSNQAYKLRAQSRWRSGNFHLAVEDAVRAAKIDPDFAQELLH